MNNQLVDIEVKNLFKAKWNYKTDGTEEQIEKLCNSIKEDKSVGVLAVREIKKGFEVIDGNHRLEAIKRLNWVKAPCENFGNITTAKAITVARRRNSQWFEDDAVKYADIFKNIVLKEYSLEDLSKIMPDTEQELESISKLTDFDWSQYDEKGVIEENKIKTIKITVSEPIYKLWEKWKNKCSNVIGYESDNASFEYAIIEALNIPDKEINMDKFKNLE